MPASPSMKDVSEFFLGKLPTEQRRQLDAAVALATSEGRFLRVGTACSGTDSPVAVFRGLAKAMPRLKVEHTFSCESDVKKRQWITDNFPDLPYLFGDIQELPTGKAFNYITGKAAQVPPVDIFIAGFVCKSVSLENNERNKCANCIIEACGLTGITFQGMIQYVQQFQPAVVICENRCWMWAFRGLAHAGAAALAGEAVLALRQERHWEMNALFRSVKASDVDMRRPLNERERSVVQKVLSKLSPRERGEEVVVDVGKSLERAVYCVGAAPCVVPNSRPCRVKKDKLLSPEQVHAAQGIFKEDFPALARWGKEKKILTRDLAGNAFSTTVCMAVAIAVLCHGPLLGTGALKRIQAVTEEHLEGAAAPATTRAGASSPAAGGPLAKRPSVRAVDERDSRSWPSGEGVAGGAVVAERDSRSRLSACEEAPRPGAASPSPRSRSPVGLAGRAETGEDADGRAEELADEVIEEAATRLLHAMSLLHAETVVDEAMAEGELRWKEIAELCRPYQEAAERWEMAEAERDCHAAELEAARTAAAGACRAAHRDPEVKQLKEALRKKDRVLRRVAGTLHRVAARLVASTEKERNQQDKRSQPVSQLSLASVMRDKEDMWSIDAAIAAACPPAMAMEAYRIDRAQCSAPTPSTYNLKGKRTKKSKKQVKQTADTKIRQSVPAKKITASIGSEDIDLEPSPSFASDDSSDDSELTTDAEMAVILNIFASLHDGLRDPASFTPDIAMLSYKDNVEAKLRASPTYSRMSSLLRDAVLITLVESAGTHGDACREEIDKQVENIFSDQNMRTFAMSQLYQAYHVLFTTTPGKFTSRSKLDGRSDISVEMKVLLREVTKNLDFPDVVPDFVRLACSEKIHALLSQVPVKTWMIDQIEFFHFMRYQMLRIIGHFSKAAQVLPVKPPTVCFDAMLEIRGPPIKRPADEEQQKSYQWLDLSNTAPGPAGWAPELSQNCSTGSGRRASCRAPIRQGLTKGQLSQGQVAAPNRRSGGRAGRRLSQRPWLAEPLAGLDDARAAAAQGRAARPEAHGRSQGGVLAKGQVLRALAKGQGIPHYGSKADLLARAAARASACSLAVKTMVSLMPASPSMKDVSEFFLGKLPTEQRQQFDAAVALATSEGRFLRVGTACSGTDSPVAVFRGLAKAMPRLKVEHAFSCESDVKKRQWITDNFPDLPYLFGDIQELPTGKAFNYITGKAAQVPPVDIFIAGFVCKSVSLENNERNKCANCIIEACGLTGITFQGMIQYVQQFQPAVVICENVEGLRCWMWAFRGLAHAGAAALAGEAVLALRQERHWEMNALFRSVKASDVDMRRPLNERERSVVQKVLSKLSPRERGEEVHAAQGIFKEDFPALARWGKEKKILTRDLAGNAFSTTVCMAVAIAVLCHGPLLGTGALKRIQAVTEEHLEGAAAPATPPARASRAPVATTPRRAQPPRAVQRTRAGASSPAAGGPLAKRLRVKSSDVGRQCEF
ncbi:unnamed protein product [Prorocentrum cordatum]|uniref:DNA (cytosine-5-)-methyltransferase n=1 Tax=Prorocentrum cordatum TaxID=2364126 RepID=A0ABN9QVN3_9DINO|nr:unnamed protein product [Polarella glacialis]